MADKESGMNPRAVGRNGEVGLLQHGAELRLAAADAFQIDAAPFRIELGTALELRVDAAADLLDVELDQAEASWIERIKFHVNLRIKAFNYWRKN